MSWNTTIYRICRKRDCNYNIATYEFACVTYLTHRYGFCVFDLFAIGTYFTCKKKKISLLVLFKMRKYKMNKENKVCNNKKVESDPHIMKAVTWM